jgi:hypothetical protein
LLGGARGPGGEGGRPREESGGRPTAVLIGLRSDESEDPQRSLDELERLAHTDGVDVAERVLQTRPGSAVAASPAVPASGSAAPARCRWSGSGARCAGG